MLNYFKFVFAICFSLVISSVAYSKGKPSSSSKTSGSTGVHITANPNAYFLSEELILNDTSYNATLSQGTEWFVVPDVERLRRELSKGTTDYYIDEAHNTVWAENVVFGYDIMVNTYATIGNARTDGEAPLFPDKLMNCTSCHAQGGTVPGSYPLFRASTFYGIRDISIDPTNVGVDENPPVGKLYGNLGYNRDIITRIRDCGVHCAGGGNIPEHSKEMNGLVLWTRAVRDGIYPNEGLIADFKLNDNLVLIPGARISVFDKVLDKGNIYTENELLAADPIAGEKLYKSICASCHGRNGEGKWTSRNGFSTPPLAGGASFTKAGGPYMVPVLAAFIKKQMPLSNPGSLSEREALDIAAHISNLNRESRWWQDYFFEHNPCGRPAFLPLDVGTTPVGYTFSSEQTKFGPWKAINTWLKSKECAEQNEPSPPKLVKDFFTGFDKNTNSFTKPICEAVDPILLARRISTITNPEYICYSDESTYFEYIVESAGNPQFDLGLELFGGIWYSYYYEFLNPLPEGVLPEFNDKVLTEVEVQQCSRAFEPTFTCPSP